MMMMVLALAGAAIAADAVKVSVANVAFKQRYPWNGLVDITCDVVATDATAPVLLWTMARDNATGLSLPMDHVWLASDTSKTNALIVKSGKAHLVWDAGADCPGTISKKIAIGVQAYPAEGLRMYMVVDLSSGCDSSSYPVTYLDRVPAGGWTDEYKTTKLVMRLIQPGTFMMGSPTNEVGRRDDETQHQVTITKPYYLGVFEVTQQQSSLVINKTSSYDWYDPLLPVNYISWDTVYAGDGFIARLRARTGLGGMCLPTEAQWEYACRAGSSASEYSGMDLVDPNCDSNLDQLGRYVQNRNGLNGGFAGGPTAVGAYSPNLWGLYDMYGNVAEWCEDKYEAFSDTAVIDPIGCVTDNGGKRVLRGGGWYQPACYLRSASRDFNYAYRVCAQDNGSGGWGEAFYKSAIYGFRLCCNPERK